VKLKLIINDFTDEMLAKHPHCNFQCHQNTLTDTKNVITSMIDPLVHISQNVGPFRFVSPISIPSRSLPRDINDFVRSACTDQTTLLPALTTRTNLWLVVREVHGMTAAFPRKTVYPKEKSVIRTNAIARHKHLYLHYVRSIIVHNVFWCIRFSFFSFFLLLCN
jgi:hypothetical protein